TLAWSRSLCPRQTGSCSPYRGHGDSSILARDRLEPSGAERQGQIFTSHSPSFYDILRHNSAMNSKPVSSDRAQAFSFASRVFSFVNKKRVKLWLWVGVAVLLLIGCVFAEIQTSLLQSWFFTRTNKRLSYQLAAGRSTGIAYPRSAPFDDRRGYSKLPAFEA